MHALVTDIFKVTRQPLELELYFILIQAEGLPMTFPEIVKTTLWDIIDEMSHSLLFFCKNPDKDFIRKRKLDFKKMMHLIIFHGKRKFKS